MVYRLLKELNGHFYVCGDCAMAEGVSSTLRQVFQVAGGLNEEDSESFLMKLQVLKMHLAIDKCAGLAFGHDRHVCRNKMLDGKYY